MVSLDKSTNGRQQMANKTCHCIIKHPATKAEYKRVNEALEYARSVNDSVGAMMALGQLSGSCPAKNERHTNATHMPKMFESEE